LGGASSFDNSGTLETGGAGRGAIVTDPAKDAGNGGHGGWIVLDFTSITKNGVIRTGNGGDGGTVLNDATGNRIQKPGGRGGSSAEISMWSRGDVVAYNFEGELRTGRGGRGGSTTADQLGIKGGDGGNSGRIRQFAIGAPRDNPKTIEVNVPGSLIVGDRGGEGSGSFDQDGKRGRRGLVALYAYSLDKASPSKLTLGSTTRIDCGSLTLWMGGYMTFSLAGLGFEKVKVSGESDPPEEADPLEVEIVAGCKTAFETRDGNNPPR
jgi:hypothetical protein